MGNAKQCDRCKQYYRKEDLLKEFSLTDKEWRYSIEFDAHPYSAHKLDLCIECTKSLYSWLKQGEKNNG